MTDEITTQEPNIERAERFQSLQAGQYWRALVDVIEEGIDEGTVLLIQSIRWVDDAPHTVILRPHPSKIGHSIYLHLPQEDGTTRKTSFYYKEHRFLLQDFLARFEFEPDHQIVRSEELRQIQGRINSLQGELVEAQSNPALLAAVVEAGLREQAQQEAATDTEEEGGSKPVAADHGLVSLATGTVVAALGTGITVEGIASLRASANREHQVATIKAEWIQSKTSAIAETIVAMTPFYSEQAAAALAQTEDVRSYVAKLMKGIESLDLYVGKDVEVETIRTGDSAPKDVPLTFVQKKLLMDEELAVYTDIDEWFDFSKEDKFFDAIRNHDALINQIFPTERCVLVMAVTRRHIDYGDNLTNATRNAENKKVFLLVRDGMNVHRVFSPVESHLGAARLFPSKNDQDAMFRGFDGGQIKFEDVAYTDKLAAHEKFALHYKRFLLLVCGLDHRLKLFGDFYEGPQSFHFVSMDFQEKHCRFLHDDDGAGLLPSGEKRMPLKDWIEEKNSYLRSGSRVLCNWAETMNPHSAPGACKEEHGGRGFGGRGFDRRYAPHNDMDVVIAYREGESICVDIEVSGHSYRSYNGRTFNCKVNLSKFKSNYWEHTDQPFLCLDAVRLEDLHWYIHNRDVRRNHLSYIRFFKRALKHLQDELVVESDTRQRLANALAEGGIATGDQAEEIVRQAVIAWRAANRGRALPCFEGNSAPAAWKSLLDQMYMLAGEGKHRTSEIEAFVRGLGYEPLRLVLSGAAKLVVYAAPISEERDDRIEPHAWVHRITVERGKTKCIEKARRWVVLPQSAASETTLHQWEAAEEWSGRDSVFQSYEHKQDILGGAANFAARLRPFTGTMDTTTHFLQMEDWERIREDMMSKSKYVQNPSMAVPFGVVYYPKIKELHYLCVGSRYPHVLLYRLAPDDATREHVKNSFIKQYANKAAAREGLAMALESKSNWSLREHLITPGQSKCGVYCGGDREIDGKKRHDPSLSPWFESWMAEVSKYGRVWLADGAVDDSGRLVFDDMLDIQPAAGLDPVRVIEITVQPHDGSSPPRFTRWFDICGGEEAPRQSGNGWWPINNEDTKRLVAGCAPEGTFGWRAETHHLASPEAARDFIKAKPGSVSDAGCRVVPANDLMDAPQPPEGVERWYWVEGEA